LNSPTSIFNLTKSTLQEVLEMLVEHQIVVREITTSGHALKKRGKSYLGHYILLCRTRGHNMTLGHLCPTTQT